MKNLKKLDRFESAMEDLNKVMDELENIKQDLEFWLDECPFKEND